jgi:hypothetical protein
MGELMMKVVAGAVVLLIAVVIKKVAFKSKISSLFRLCVRRVEIDGKPVEAYARGIGKGEPQVLAETQANLQKRSSCFRLRLKARSGAPSLIRWEGSSLAFPRGESCAVSGYSVGRPGPLVELADDEWADLIVCLGRGGISDPYSGSLSSFEERLSFAKEGSEEVVLNLKMILGGGSAASDVKVALEVRPVEAGEEVQYFDHEKAIDILKTLKRVG